jgi:hypothetical protein
LFGREPFTVAKVLLLDPVLCTALFPKRTEFA